MRLASELRLISTTTGSFIMPNNLFTLVYHRTYLVPKSSNRSPNPEKKIIIIIQQWRWRDWEWLDVDEHGVQIKNILIITGPLPTCGCSLVVRIPRCGRGDLGSNPSSHIFFSLFLPKPFDTYELIMKEFHSEFFLENITDGLTIKNFSILRIVHIISNWGW